MCAHRTPFGPLPPTAPVMGDNLERVAVTRGVVGTLRGHLTPRRAPQLGLLFGAVQGDTLTLAVAMRASWPSVQTHDAFNIDERLLLGACEALGFLSSGQLQWCGVWHMHADAQLGRTETDAKLIRRAVRRGLVDDRRIWLSVGWEDGAFALQAFLGYGSATPVQLMVETLQFLTRVNGR